MPKASEAQRGEQKQNEALFVVGFSNHIGPSSWSSASEKAL